MTDRQREETLEAWKKRAGLFMNSKIPVHIKTVDGMYLGGLILRIYNGSFDIDDNKLGEWPVDFSEVVKLTKLKVEGSRPSKAETPNSHEVKKEGESDDIL